MELLKYTEKHMEFRERLALFVEKEIRPRRESFEADHIFPKKVWSLLGKNGFLCTNIATEYGGPGGDFLYSVIICEEISKGSQGGLAITLHSDIVVPYLDSYGTPEQKARYLPGCVSGDIITAVAMTEPDAGSDLASMTTTAVVEGDEIVLNGAKTFISNGINADLVILAARDPSVENPHESLSLFLVEDGTSGFKRGRKLDKMGLYSQDTAELFFTNCRIPLKNRLGEPGQGFLMLMQKLQQERLMCTIMAQVAAERIVEWTTDYCKNTKIDGKPLSRFQANQFALVELACELKIGRTFMEKLVADHMEGQQVVIETSMAKYWSTDMVKRIADRCLDLIGNNAYLQDNLVARAFRDVRVMSIFAGTNEIMKIVAGRFMGL